MTYSLNGNYNLLSDPTHRIHYTGHHPVYKDSSKTTPLRIVNDPKMKNDGTELSTNDVMHKEAGKMTVGSGSPHTRFRNVFIAGQLACAVVCLEDGGQPSLQSHQSLGGTEFCPPSPPVQGSYGRAPNKPKESSGGCRTILPRTVRALRSCVSSLCRGHERLLRSKSRSETGPSIETSLVKNKAQFYNKTLDFTGTLPYSRLRHMANIFLAWWKAQIFVSLVSYPRYDSRFGGSQFRSCRVTIVHQDEKSDSRMDNGEKLLPCIAKENKPYIMSGQRYKDDSSGTLSWLRLPVPFDKTQVGAKKVLVKENKTKSDRDHSFI